MDHIITQEQFTKLYAYAAMFANCESLTEGEPSYLVLDDIQSAGTALLDILDEARKMVPA